MQDIRYIMVTSWNNYWDNVAPGKTFFTRPLIKADINDPALLPEANTLFIKRSNGTVERAWIGKSRNFRHDSYKSKPTIHFDISDLQEEPCPNEFKNYVDGWYELSREDIADDPLQPAFFKAMGTTRSWEEFEWHCFHLLRVTGIHDIHTIPKESSRGRADGFFCFDKLAVIYDATLSKNYITDKEQQIGNYINQLKQEMLTFEQNSYTIKGMDRQVWLITRDTAVRLIRNVDRIKVKAIPYTKLIEVYNRRLRERIDMEGLLNILKDL